MTETDIKVLHDPYPGEYWTQTSAHRWAVLDTTTTEPPMLQVAWQSSYGRIKWARVETVFVSQHEYEQN